MSTHEPPQPLLYRWPDSAKVDRELPKAKIYEQTHATKGLKELFVRGVDRITWSHKLAESTVRLRATEQVHEIQVFRLALRTETIHHEILSSIDRVIPSPIIFEIIYENQVSTIATYKRLSPKDQTPRLETKSYFQSPWYDAETDRAAFPTALDLGWLYDGLLGPLIDHQSAEMLIRYGHADLADRLCLHKPSPETREPLQDRMDSFIELESSLKEIERMRKRLDREKQFNRKVEINQALRKLLDELQNALV